MEPVFALLLSLVSQPAEAQASPEAEPPPAYDLRWDGRYGRATAMSTVGLAATGAFVALRVVGYSMERAAESPDDPLYDVGYDIGSVGGAGLFVSIPVTAGASLRARRALVERGASVPRGPGYLSWGAWGATYAFATVGVALANNVEIEYHEGVTVYRRSPFVYVCEAGAYASQATAIGAGLWQVILNRRAEAELPTTAGVHPPEDRGLSVALAPTLTKDAVGLGLHGRW